MTTPRGPSAGAPRRVFLIVRLMPPTSHATMLWNRRCRCNECAIVGVEAAGAGELTGPAVSSSADDRLGGEESWAPIGHEQTLVRLVISGRLVQSAQWALTTDPRAAQLRGASVDY
jgi:hypothetical protein